MVIPGESWNTGVVQAHTISVVKTVLEAGKAAGLQPALQTGTVCWNSMQLFGSNTAVPTLLGLGHVLSPAPKVFKTQVVQILLCF